MKLIAKDKLHIVGTFRNCYVVQVELRLKDFHYLILGKFKEGKHDSNITNLLETLQRMDKKFPQEMESGDTYEDVLGYLEWFGGVESWEDMLKRHADIAYQYPVEDHDEAFTAAEGFKEEWPHDTENRPAQLEHYQVFYYSEDGYKYNVEVKD